MQVGAETFTKLRLQKIFNLFQDPFERADITSNTFWDWQRNHVGQMHGVVREIEIEEQVNAKSPSLEQELEKKQP